MRFLTPHTSSWFYWTIHKFCQLMLPDTTIYNTTCYTSSKGGKRAGQTTCTLVRWDPSSCALPSTLKMTVEERGVLGYWQGRGWFVSNLNLDQTGWSFQITDIQWIEGRRAGGGSSTLLEAGPELYYLIVCQNVSELQCR